MSMLQAKTNIKGNVVHSKSWYMDKNTHFIWGRISAPYIVFQTLSIPSTKNMTVIV